MGYYHGYFLLAGVIWQAYLDGKITALIRDRRLAALKARYNIE